MKKTLLTTLALIGMSFSLSAQANLPIKIKQGMDYQKARKILLKSGWQIVPMNVKPNGMPVCYPSFGKKNHCKGQFEIAYCAPTGLAYCQMVFYDGRKTYLDITTIGEEPSIHRWEKTTRKPEINVIE